MRAYQVQTTDGFEAIQKIDTATPEPGPGEILVKLRACSLNYRDLLIPLGGYHRNTTRPIVPVSDGAGEVVAVGDGVTEWQPGDRVVGNFFQDWVSGPIDEAGLTSSMGGAINGVLSEYFLLKAHGALRVPERLSFEEAATLPCAAVTAWHGLVPRGHIKAGDVVLAQGTGGVSIFALQIAKAMGAEVIITSSSDEKLARAKAMGADHGINYRTTPDWDEAALELTGGRGVDHVVEVGGEQTFEKSINCTRVYGTISVIGIVSGFNIPFSLLAALNMLTINGIYVGSVEMFRDMMAFMDEHQIKPVVDQTFDFENAMDAFRMLASAKHFGKIVITNS